MSTKPSHPARDSVGYISTCCLPAKSVEDTQRASNAYLRLGNSADNTVPAIFLFRSVRGVIIVVHGILSESFDAPSTQRIYE